MISTRLRDLPLDVVDLLRRGDGLIRVSSAEDAAVGIDRLLRLADSGMLLRVAAGVYTSVELYTAADERARHLLRARAFMSSCSDDALLAADSAATAWHLPTIGAPPTLPTVVRPKRPGLGPTTTRYGRVLVSNVPPSHRCRTHGMNVVSSAWAVTDLARTGPVLPALVAADAAAAAGAELADAVLYQRHWPGVGRARWVARHADPLAESPVETLGRFTCLQFDLPLPVCNAWVGVDGPEYRVDGLWPFHWSAFEADGALKYDNRPDASRIVARQGEREWRLRRLGLDIVRFGWDLAWRNRADLAARFAAVLRDDPRRDQAIRWWKHVPGVGAVNPEPADWPSPVPGRTCCRRDGTVDLRADSLTTSAGPAPPLGAEPITAG